MVRVLQHYWDMNAATKYDRIVAIDPRTGLTLRAATEHEAAAYYAQPVRHVSFLRPVTVDGALIADVGCAPEDKGERSYDWV